MTKKGFTLVELISTFALAAVIIVLLMNVVILIKDVYNQNNVKTELMIEQSNLSKIMNEEFNKELVDYEWCSDTSFCYNFNFLDGSTSKLTIENNKITFNNYVYKMDKGVEIVNPKISKEYIDINVSEEHFMKIKIPIISKLYPNKDFGIDLVFNGNVLNNEEPEETSICTLANDSNRIEGQIGAKYNCKVDPNKEPYTFYILSHNEDGTSNLILDRNVYYNSDTDTGLTDENNLGNVEWYESRDNRYGPVTAMTYLYNATKQWTNVPNISINKTNKIDVNFGYGGLETLGNQTKIIKRDGTETAIFTNLKARLPYKNEVIGTGKCLILTANEQGSCPLWLVNYLDMGPYYSTLSERYKITGLGGYWTLDSESKYSVQYDTSEPIYAWFVGGYGFANYYYVSNPSNKGVRPVITLQL